MQLITDYPLAATSDDHNFPEGIYKDNNLCIEMIYGIEGYFGKKINFMDIGCAGGKLAVTMNQRGHTAVGLEGSDHCINVRDEWVRRIGHRPLGEENWSNYHNKVLFTCDVSKPYKVMEGDDQYKCDLISSWDVMEHFHEEDVPQVLKNIYNHLKPSGLFIATIAIGSALKPVEEETFSVDYHKCVKSVDWWHDQLSKFFVSTNYIFGHTNRPVCGGNFLYCGRKK